MSSREPLWFCHECHAEMRPLMVPDPVCASCRGSFVEKMENPEDDPREFAHPAHADTGGDGHPGIDTFLMTLQRLMERGADANARTNRTDGNAPRARSITIELGGNGTRVVSLGGPNTLGTGGGAPQPANTNSVPTMSETGPGIGGRNGHEMNPTISGNMMAQYLMALLGQHDPFTALLGGGLPENGRMGDYVFNQEALDQIITQIMENSNAHRPVPATDEIMENLPREVLEEGSATLEKDCAVCKEQFKLETEDPDEQVVVTLPCKHPFHEPCIIPWLKSSGTCPVCRHQLIPQPEQQPLPATVGQDQGNAQSGSTPSRSPRSDREPDHGGIFQAIFGGLTGGNSEPPSRGRESRNQISADTSSPDGSDSSRPHRSTSDPSSRSANRPNDHGNNLPGSWTEELD